MLVDPLTDDPLVVTGSANWSDESSTDNDENILVIRGKKRAADLYLTDYMRSSITTACAAGPGAAATSPPPAPVRGGQPRAAAPRVGRRLDQAVLRGRIARGEGATAFQLSSILKTLSVDRR